MAASGVGGGPTEAQVMAERLLAEFASCDMTSVEWKMEVGSDTEVVSCVCRECLHHFRVKVTGGSPIASFDVNHTTGMHIYAFGGRDGTHTLRATRVGDDHVMDRCHLVCTVDNCYSKVEFERLGYRVSRGEIDMLNDAHRTARHFKEALAQDADRFRDLENIDWNCFDMLLTYIADGLNTKDNESPKKIKTQNRKFMVGFSHDFDDLFRTLGLSHTVDNSEEMWVFPKLEPAQAPTRLGTQRSKWEEFESELLLFSTKDNPRRGRPAWDMLTRLLHSNYASVSGKPSIHESDMALLGCLANYQPYIFVEAAKFLAEKCPMRRDEFLKAAERSIGSNEDAQTRLLLYRSSFDAVDTIPSASPEILDAFAFFDTTPTGQTSVDHFVSKSMVFLDANKAVNDKLQLIQNLRTVGDYLHQDLVTLVSGVLPDVSDQLAGPHTGAMNPDRVAEVLAPAQVDWTPEFAESVVNNLLQDSTKDRQEIADALKTCAKWQRDRGHTENAAKYEEWAGIFKADGAVKPNDIEAGQQAIHLAMDRNTPPGLRNIGNTCYLNSLLQYLYSVKAVRELVLNFPENGLELNMDSIKQRRLGYANGLEFNLQEAIVGRQFVEELQSLFKDLQTTTEVATVPSQKLANTAMRSASDLLNRQKQKQDDPEVKPPPLPARPSPAPPTSTSKDADLVNVSVEPISESLETASVVSSQTLVNEEEGTSTESYVEVNLPDEERQQANQAIHNEDSVSKNKNAESLDELFSSTTDLEEKERLVAQRLEQSDRKGTDQQDVEEIIGFIFEHIMRAIRSNGPMPGKPALQADAVTDTFFPLLVHYTLKSDADLKQARAELNPDRWISTYPHPRDGVSSSMYEALDRSFDLQFVGSDLARFSAIRSLPPVMHIRIQRANATRAGSSKNRNPVILTEELYMDRYMDAAPNSDLAVMRRAAWALQGHQTALEAIDERAPSAPDVKSPEQTATVDDQAFEIIDIDSLELDEASTEYLDDTFPNSPIDSSRKRKIEGLHESAMDTPPPAKRRSTSPGARDTLMSRVTQILNAFDVKGNEKAGESEVSKENVETFYGKLTKQKYRLHAVICHSGGAVAGHYWVWVRDFERDTWIKFNDSTVTVDSRDPQVVLDELNKTGDPCYVAYVRDEDKQDIVDVPQRAMPDPSIRAAEGNDQDVEMQVIEGISPSAVEGQPEYIPMGAKHMVTKDNDIIEVDSSRPYELL
ncbi:hypothetical protein JX265_007971 [Neoarthrinium moseri]|uniref:ubiquitinyl hydrolase 1 n=1 Tax=Neoarthrinium moseri TaxID=1658444 RepID=A0A9Q0AMM1_9PEZI|nr:hypothetical protein JX265_007971 [Neoarthrinium moseri]